MQNVGAAEIRDGAVEEGMLTLRMDGWLKVMKGITHAGAGDSRDRRVGSRQGRVGRPSGARRHHPATLASFPRL